MKTSWLSAVVFTIVLVGYFAFLDCTYSVMPPRMATHFDAQGQANGWMNRSSAVIFQGVIGLIVPGVLLAVIFMLRFAPQKQINMPRADFWFGPEHRRETCAYIMRQGFWLASMLVLFQYAIWYELIQSNSEKIPQLSLTVFLSVIGVFAVALVAWVMNLFRHFRKTA